jgi:hypothetical protein
MADDQERQRGWAAILSAVKTELALLALVILVVGVFFGAVSRRPEVQSGQLIGAFTSIVALVIVIAGLRLVLQARSSYMAKLTENKRFAQLLGEEIFNAYEGSMKNLLPRDQEEAYQTLHDYVTSSPNFESTAERDFARGLVDTVMRRAKQKVRSA